MSFSVNLSCDIATQAEAEAGLIDTAAMTPLKTAQAITALAPGGGGLTLGTPVATTSGTSKDYISLPAGLKRITIMFNGVSNNAGSILLLRVGDSTGFYTTGYGGAAGYLQNTNLAGVYTNSAGFSLVSGSAGNVLSGNATLTLLDPTNHIWTVSYAFGVTASATFGVVGGGVIDLANALDRIRLTSTNGTDTFDAGSINISYE